MVSRRRIYTRGAYKFDYSIHDLPQCRLLEKLAGLREANSIRQTHMADDEEQSNPSSEAHTLITPFTYQRNSSEHGCEVWNLIGVFTCGL